MLGNEPSSNDEIQDVDGTLLIGKVNCGLEIQGVRRSTSYKAQEYVDLIWFRYPWD